MSPVKCRRSSRRTHFIIHFVVLGIYRSFGRDRHDASILSLPLPFSFLFLRCYRVTPLFFLDRTNSFYSFFLEFNGGLFLQVEMIFSLFWLRSIRKKVNESTGWKVSQDGRNRLAMEEIITNHFLC